MVCNRRCSAAIRGRGDVPHPRVGRDPLARFDCLDAAGIAVWFGKLRPFRAVIEATGTCRCLYNLLSPLGTILLATLCTCGPW